MQLITSEKDINILLPIFAQKKYLSTKSNIFGWFQTDKFIIPFYIDKKLFFKRLIFTTETIYKASNNTQEEEKKFLNNILLYIRKHNICDFIFKAQGNAVFNTYPDKSIFIPWGTYEVNLEKSTEELFNSFNGKCRNVIRKALKEKVQINSTTNIDIIYNNINAMFKRQKSIHSISYNYLKSLQNNMPYNVLFLTAVHNNIIQGSLVLIYDNFKGYAMYAGSIQSPQTGSLDLLHFEAMKLLQNKNIPIYDFVGTRINTKINSKHAGIDKFKRKFNPALKEGFAFKFIIHPYKYLLFNLIVKIYFKLKGYTYNDLIDEILHEKN